MTEKDCGLRGAFELWASDDGLFPSAVARSGEGYRLIQTQCDWEAWKAAIKAACVKLYEEANFGCPDKQDEALTRENADMLLEWAGLRDEQDF